VERWGGKWGRCVSGEKIKDVSKFKRRGQDSERTQLPGSSQTPPRDSAFSRFSGQQSDHLLL
jgi:hypothetical protein